MQNFLFYTVQFIFGNKKLIRYEFHIRELKKVQIKYSKKF